MAKHMKEMGLPTGVKIGIAVTAGVLAVTLLCAVFAYGGVLDAFSSLFADNNANTTPTETTVPTTTEPEPIQPVYQKPEQIKGVWMTAGVDYYTSAKNTGKTVKQQIDSAFSAMDEWEFNTLILPLTVKDKYISIYPSEITDHVELLDENEEVFDPVLYMITLAREKKMYIYAVADLYVRADEKWDPRTTEGLARTQSMISEITARYEVDGYFLSGFTFSDEQLRNQDREAAEAALTTLIKQVTDTIRTANPNLYTGLLSNGIWAHQSVNERGSKTAEYYEEFTDGGANTLAWLEQGLFQCVMVKNYSSTSHPTASFQNVLEWWGAVAEKQQLPLYVSHSAATIGSYRTGWKNTDQLAQQYLYCKSNAAWQGSCYDSLYALRTDKTGAAEALSRAYDGTLDEEYIYKRLSLTFPTKTTYTTTESTITMHGGCDINFPLTVNGQAVELTEHGFFSLTRTLQVGVNTFEFSHKGTTTTYKITYKQTLLQSVSPEQDMTVDGDNIFIVSAVARKGSTVKATINGQSLSLTPYDVKEEESGNLPTDFQGYKATYTLPSGKIGQAIDLGKVTVTATYNGMSESKTGGKITVKALPEPPPPTTTGSNVSVPAGSPIPAPSGNVRIVTITSQYAETFSGGDLIDDYSRPYNSYLPKGTQDYLVKTVYNGSYSYYLLASGYRVYCKDATVTENGALKYTPLQDGKTTVTATHTDFTFNTAAKIPVYIRTQGQRYYDDTTKTTPNYGLENYSQTTTHIDITFSYLSEVPALPDISQSPLFSSAKWSAGAAEHSYVLSLTLKEKGKFYGVSTKWNGNQLIISFLNPARVSQNAASEKLKGVHILLDPGHGSDASADKPWEAELNLSYANTVKTKLESLGATVDMTRTGPLGNNGISLEKRVLMSQTKGYHLVISVHMNASGKELDGKGSATGATVHYYTECAYTASKFVFDKMHAVETEYGVGTTANGKPRSSGTVWGTLYMTRSIFHCPSILLECAFLDNAKDEQALRNPVYRDKLMQAVTDGVVAYFSAM